MQVVLSPIKRDCRDHLCMQGLSGKQRPLRDGIPKGLQVIANHCLDGLRADDDLKAPCLFWMEKKAVEPAGVHG